MTTTSTHPRPRAAQARREAEQREARLRRTVTWTGVTVVLALVVAVAVALLSSTGSDGRAPVPGRVVVPAGATADGAISVGPDDAPVTMSVYFDYLCPFCGRFEAANSDELDRLVQAGQVRVELRPLSFLDGQSAGTAYSSRTANALATVADGAPERVWAFHRGLFAQQPEEGAPGLTDAQLAKTATAAGVPAPVVDRFASRTFAGWVADVTERAFTSGVTGTPTVLIDGEVFDGDLYTSGPLTRALEQAVHHAVAGR